MLLRTNSSYDKRQLTKNCYSKVTLNGRPESFWQLFCRQGRPKGTDRLKSLCCINYFDILFAAGSLTGTNPKIVRDFLKNIWRHYSIRPIFRKTTQNYFLFQLERPHCTKHFKNADFQIISTVH